MIKYRYQLRVQLLSPHYTDTQGSQSLIHENFLSYIKFAWQISTSSFTIHTNFPQIKIYQPAAGGFKTC